MRDLRVEPEIDIGETDEPRHDVTKKWGGANNHGENGGGPLGWGPLNNQPHIQLI